jgi:hypothetical protein
MEKDGTEAIRIRAVSPQDRLRYRRAECAPQEQPLRGR